MKLIVNADDFGMSRGVNYGIYDAHTKGIVTSTTLMVTMPEVMHAIELSKDVPSLGIGLHLNITLGKPITSCLSLLKQNGEFYKPKETPCEDCFCEQEIYDEFRAQYDRFLKFVGRKPTHLDSHLYAHQRYPKASKAVKKLGEEMDIPIRDLQTKDYPKIVFLDWFKKTGDINLHKEFEKRINEYNGEIYELMVHPAYVDEFLVEFSTYNMPRIEELEVLTSTKIKKIIKDNKIELIGFDCVRS